MTWRPGEDCAVRSHSERVARVSTSVGFRQDLHSPAPRSLRHTRPKKKGPRSSPRALFCLASTPLLATRRAALSAASHLRHFTSEIRRGRLLDAFADLEARE